MNNKLVPYNTGRVKIGLRYQPWCPIDALDDDALMLQRALLGERTDIQKFTGFIHNITKRIGAWL